MHLNSDDFTLIETTDALEQFYEANRLADWMGLDTEFVGERRFFTTICLIQVSTSKGVFLIDPLLISDLSPLLRLIEDPKINKITHAGDNDYRLFFNLHGITPRNVVDTQIAAAFLGYKHPVAFRKLMENELGIYLDKGFTIADWETRPLNRKQLKYAVQDVLYLQPLWLSLFKKLDQLKRLDWVLEECAALENKEYYDLDPDREVLENNAMKGLSLNEQVFLLRIFRWRREEARRLDMSKEMVMPAKFCSLILKSIPSGLDAMQQNRRIPVSMVTKYGSLFQSMFKNEPTVEELSVLQRVQSEKVENSRQDVLTEMLDLMIRYKCIENNIAHEMVLPRGILKKMKFDPDFFDESLETSWRKQFLGSELLKWLRNRNYLDIEFSSGKIEIRLNEHVIPST